MLCLPDKRDCNLAVVNSHRKKISQKMVTWQVCRDILNSIALTKTAIQHCCVTSQICQHHLV